MPRRKVFHTKEALAGLRFGQLFGIRNVEHNSSIRWCWNLVCGLRRDHYGSCSNLRCVQQWPSHRWPLERHSRPVFRVFSAIRKRIFDQIHHKHENEIRQSYGSERRYVASWHRGMTDSFILWFSKIDLVFLSTKYRPIDHSPPKRFELTT